MIQDNLILLYLDVNLVVCCSEAKAASLKEGQLCVTLASAMPNRLI